ncbi:MAG: hypothetical protein Q8O76_04120, partial [Chloroflexota bacterium]|nr:hypothetical protein [Chloroflexota bacterium]
MSKRVAVGLRAAVAIMLGVGVALIPVPVLVWPHAELLKIGLVALLVVTYLGKLLYDTLFYD